MARDTWNRFAHLDPLPSAAANKVPTPGGRRFYRRALAAVLTLAGIPTLALGLLTLLLDVAALFGLGHSYPATKYLIAEAIATGLGAILVAGARELWRREPNPHAEVRLRQEASTPDNGQPPSPVSATNGGRIFRGVHSYILLVLRLFADIGLTVGMWMFVPIGVLFVLFAGVVAIITPGDKAIGAAIGLGFLSLIVGAAANALRHWIRR